ncbi:MAG TPA: Hsp20/alpha crystallin family protein [bacterium]|nr:Hsp20/alpha crystallin family protein [bacterium]HPQ19867.1 Hsp20/alpha crystallin family protein [bacterium]
MLVPKRFFDDSLLNEFFSLSNSLSKLFDDFNEIIPTHRTYPAVNMYEDNDNIYVTAEIPGVEEKDIKISATNNSLTIEGKHEQKKEEKNASYYLQERSYGSFSRTISLNKKVDINKIKAKLKNGLLTVTLPKAEEEKAKAIEVKVE